MVSNLKNIVVKNLKIGLVMKKSIVDKLSTFYQIKLLK